jgi:hypothetical protein
MRCCEMPCWKSLKRIPTCHRAKNCWHKPARPWVPPERRVQRQPELLAVVAQRGLRVQQVQQVPAVPLALPLQAQQQPVLSGPP